MKQKDIKIGDIYRVKEESQKKCGGFIEEGGVYIRVTATTGEYLCYDILDKDKEKLDWCNCFTPDDLLPLDDPGRTLDDLQVGDIVENNDGDRRKVLGRAFTLSYSNYFHVSADTWSLDDLKEYGYRLIQPDSKEMEAKAYLEKRGYKVTK